MIGEQSYCSGLQQGPGVSVQRKRLAWKGEACPHLGALKRD